MENTVTISYAAERTGLSVHTLRYYEQQGLLPFVDRNEAGVRVFKDSDFEWLDLINCLKGTGMHIKDIAHFVSLCMVGDDTLDQRLELFREHKLALEEQMREQKRFLEKINWKINWYENACEERDARQKHQREAVGNRA